MIEGYDNIFLIANKSLLVFKINVLAQGILLLLKNFFSFDLS